MSLHESEKVAQKMLEIALRPYLSNPRKLRRLIGQANRELMDEALDAISKHLDEVTTKLDAINPELFTTTEGNES